MAQGDNDTPDRGEGEGRRRVGPRFEQVVRERLKREGWTPPDETPPETTSSRADDSESTGSPKGTTPRWPTPRALWRMPIKVISYAVPILVTLFLLKTFGGLALSTVPVPEAAREGFLRVLGTVFPGARGSIVDKYQVTLVSAPSRETPELVVQVVKYRELVQTLAERVELTRLKDDRTPAADEPLWVSVGGRDLRDAVVTGEDGRATIDLRRALARGRYRQDSTLIVSVGLPNTEYQRSYRYAVRDLLGSYYAFGDTPYAAFAGGELVGTTSADLAYETVETGAANTYRITLADGAQRWVMSGSAEWKGYRREGDGPVVTAVSLRRSRESDPEPPSGEPVAAAPLLGVGVTRALLVGVDLYEHHPNLANPVSDVDAIEAELRDVYNVRVTTLRNPTRREFLMSLYARAGQAYERNDQLLVYFAGHGWFDERLRRGFLALSDSEPLAEDHLRDTLVSHEDVRTILERLDCEHVLLVLDSCFSGTVDPTVAMAPATRALTARSGVISTAEYLERKLAFRTRRYITAGRNEYVPDGRPGAHSPFSRQFLEALRSYGGADSVLTLEEIQAYLERVDPQPRAGELIGNEPGSSFVLVAGAVTLPEPTPVPAEYGTLTVTVRPGNAVPTLQEIERVEYPPAAFADSVGPDGATHRFYVRVGSYRVHLSLDGETVRTVDVRVDPGEQAIALDGSRDGA